jgi:hypothetical protein
MRQVAVLIDYEYESDEQSDQFLSALSRWLGDITAVSVSGMRIVHMTQLDDAKTVREER